MKRRRGDARIPIVHMGWKIRRVEWRGRTIRLEGVFFAMGLITDGQLSFEKRRRLLVRGSVTVYTTRRRTPALALSLLLQIPFLTRKSKEYGLCQRGVPREAAKWG